MNEFSNVLFGMAMLVNALIALLTLIATLRSKKDIKNLEINTNSIKDALVKVTGEAEHAKGVIVGVQKQKSREKEIKS